MSSKRSAALLGAQNAAETRETRGLAIAARCRIKRKGAAWLVPSAKSGEGPYTVSLPSYGSADAPRCNCPDHELRGVKCKHIYAVEITIQREENDDGSVTETVTMTQTVKRKTYPQNWPAYNAAQTNEKDRLQILLRDLCKGIQDTRAYRTGRRPIPLNDAIFSAVFKVYSTISGRRFMSDLRDAHAKGFIHKLPCYNSLFNILESPETTSVLKSLIVQSALPLKAIETNFACDSTGFSSSRFDRWFDHKWGEHRMMRAWVKAHVMTGVKTNVITAVEIEEPTAADSLFLKPMLATTAANFKVDELSADMAYLSKSNLETVAEHGALPLIPFKTKCVATTPGLWNTMFHFFHLHREEFLARYHLRSNVESTFSMIKAKFGDGVRSKTDTAMKNEVLAKILCHNICCLISAIYELGIDPVFWSKEAACSGPSAVG